MIGSFSFDPPPAPLDYDATVVWVCKYDPITGGEPYTLIPNVQWDEVQDREGLEPRSARFHYVLDDRAIAEGWPTQPEQIFDLAGSTSKYVVNPDDRIVVLCDRGEKQKPLVLFDGFAQAPQVNMEPASQIISFTTSNVGIR